MAAKFAFHQSLTFQNTVLIQKWTTIMSCMLFWSMLASQLTPVIITVTVGHRRELGAGIF